MWYKLQVPAHRKLKQKGHEFKASLTGWPQTHYVAKDDFERLIILPSPPECWGDRHATPPLVYGVLGMEPRISVMLDNQFTH